MVATPSDGAAMAAGESMSEPADVAALLAKENIRTLSRQNMRGLDRLDADPVRSVLFDAARVDYGFSAVGVMRR
jgi:hypothetical protein